jgi:hypothetical protein
MDVSTSAAHKRIQMMNANAKRNSVHGLSTVTREQAMAMRKHDPELNGCEVPELSPVRNLPSPPPAKRSSLPDLRKLSLKGKKKSVDLQTFGDMPLFSVSKNSLNQPTKMNPEVEEVKQEVTVVSSKRKSLPPVMKNVVEAAVASNSKRNSAPQVPAHPVFNFADKYSLGEVVLVTLSDGRPMCGEIVNISKDTMLMEYAEDRYHYRALIKVQYDPDSDEPMDDLVSVMETTY